ncbi:hypothetical protein JCM19235_5778 [Vibrio maritimus]|uniref:Uncharacterized protein n=1 Tax=Vibrio maritimus TaxID=990268 RepID=A0A090RSM2_9VIBR|nr:hypothetical protein JCM19235_5778 [Vibrio maritimus]
MEVVSVSKNRGSVIPVSVCPRGFFKLALWHQTQSIYIENKQRISIEI